MDLRAREEDYGIGIMVKSSPAGTFLLSFFVRIFFGLLFCCHTASAKDDPLEDAKFCPVATCCFVLLNRYLGIVKVPGFPQEPAKGDAPTIVSRRHFSLPCPPFDNLGCPPHQIHLHENDFILHALS